MPLELIHWVQEAIFQFILTAKAPVHRRPHISWCWRKIWGRDAKVGGGLRKIASISKMKKFTRFIYVFLRCSFLLYSIYPLCPPSLIPVIDGGVSGQSTIEKSSFYILGTQNSPPYQRVLANVFWGNQPHSAINIEPPVVTLSPGSSIHRRAKPEVSPVPCFTAIKTTNLASNVT